MARATRNRVEVRRPQPCPDCPERRLPDDFYTNHDQGKALWKHVLIGTRGCILMLHDYANVAMPGFDPSQIEALRTELAKVISTHEANNARQAADLPSTGEADNRGIELQVGNGVQPAGSESVTSGFIGFTDDPTQLPVLQLSGDSGPDGPSDDPEHGTQ
jgi:hypothetical protein